MTVYKYNLSNTELSHISTLLPTHLEALHKHNKNTTFHYVLINALDMSHIYCSFYHFPSFIFLTVYFCNHCNVMAVTLMT